MKIPNSLKCFQCKNYLTDHTEEDLVSCIVKRSLLETVYTNKQLRKRFKENTRQRKSGLSKLQLNILNKINNEPNTNAYLIGKNFNMRAGTVSKIIERFVIRQLITKEEVQKGKVRRNNLTITELGKLLLEVVKS